MEISIRGFQQLTKRCRTFAAVGLPGPHSLTGHSRAVCTRQSAGASNVLHLGSAFDSSLRVAASLVAAAAAGVAAAAPADEGRAGTGLHLGHRRARSGTFARCEQAEATRPGVPKGQGLLEGRDFAVFRRSPGGLHSSPAASAESLGELLSAVTYAPTAGAAAAEGHEGSSGGGPSVVLLGEVHNDEVAHKLQLQVLQHCHGACRAQGRQLVLSLEMFESDVQEVLDEYIVRRGIREQDMLQDARPWANYPQDYRPLVEFCREQGIRVIAANAPRRYVSLVAREGVGALQQLLDGSGHRHQGPPLPLPPASASYRQKFIETIASEVPAAQADNEEGCPFIGFQAAAVREARPQMLDAQLLWDHTMAKSIARALQEARSSPTGATGPGPLILHVCGAFHCAHGLGIPEALPHYTEAAPATPGISPPGEATPWLPMDDDLQEDTQGGTPAVKSGDAFKDTEAIGPKLSPPGVISVVCWPATVSATCDLVKAGDVPQSLGTMGDWVVITEETWDSATTSDRWHHVAASA